MGAHPQQFLQMPGGQPFMGAPQQPMMMMMPQPMPMYTVPSPQGTVPQMMVVNGQLVSLHPVGQRM